MPTTITIPDFSWLAEFYPEIYQALLVYKRQHLPELSEEAPDDPVMQFIAMAAIIGHLVNVRGDFTARELYVPTLRRRTSLNALLRLIDQRLNEASPAVADVLARLTRTFTADEANLVPARSVFSTIAGENTDPIGFESGAAAQGVQRTDQLGTVWGFDSGLAAYVAWAAGAAPWVTAAEAGDMIYFGHADAMWDAMDIDLSVAQAGIAAVWEYSGDSEATPTGVSWVSPNLTFDLTSLLGAFNRTGALVTILCVPTGQSATFSSTWSGAVNQVVTTATLGQGATPSTTAADYVLSVTWTGVTVTGNNADLNNIAADDTAWTLPQAVTANWEQRAVNGTTSYWLRWRVISVVGPTSPVLNAAIDPTTGDFYVLVEATQGETIEDDLGNSDGTASQTFALNRSPYIEGTLTALLVGADPNWVVTEEPADFFGADPAELIAFLDVQEDGSFEVRFGDGVNGAIPPVGDAIVATYRIGAEDDGNVGAGTITQNTSGLGYVTDLTNPRPASGWQAPQGSTEADLEIQKRLQPASMRTRNRAVTPNDCSVLVVDEYTTPDGSRPIVRAWGNEEEYGVGTIGLRVVGAGGGFASAAILTAIGEFLNGTDPNDPDRRLVANLELTAANFISEAIDGAITVSVAGSTVGVESAVQDVLTELLDPLAVQEDGTWEWEPGGGAFEGRVSPTQIAGAIWLNRATVGDVRDVEVTDVDGGGPVTLILADNELPRMGTWVVTVTAV